MRWFYLTSLGLTLLLAGAPFLLLSKDGDLAEPGKIVGYSTYGAKIRSIDPAACEDTLSRAFQAELYEGLYGYHYLKRPVELLPRLAEAMPEVSPDGLTYTIRLRENVRYRRNECFPPGPDGVRTREVVAEDFVLAFKRIADFHVESMLAKSLIQDRIVGIREYYAKTKTFARGDFSRYDLPLAGVEAVDSRTLRIRLREPFPRLSYVLAMENYAPIPREVIDYYLTSQPDGRGGREPIPLTERDPVIRDPNAAVGTGPYYLDDWVPANKVILRRNRDYRPQYYPSEGAPGDEEAGLLVDKGKRIPFVDVKHYTYVEEANPSLMLFLTRQVDSAGIPTELMGEIVTPDKKLLKEWVDMGIRLQTATEPSIYWFGFNMRDRILGSSKSLRQALSLAFNVEEYIEVIWKGRSIPAVNYVPSSFVGHKEAGPGPYSRYDVDQAKRLLVKAKQELVAAGVLAPGDQIPPLRLDLGGRSNIYRKMALYTQEQFKKIGIDVEIELNDWPTHQDKINRKLVQMFSIGWMADYPDPENFLQNYYSPNIKRGTNETNYFNPTFDKLYEKIIVMESSPERTALCAEAIRILNEDCPCLLLTEPIYMWLEHTWVNNYKRHPLGAGFRRFIRIDAEARRKAGGR